MVYNWTQKSVWSGGYYLKDGERILWEFDNQGRLAERLQHRVVQHGVIKERGTILYYDDLEVEMPRFLTPRGKFNVREAASGEILVQVHISYSLLDVGLWFPGKKGYELGYLLSRNGDRFVFAVRNGFRLVEMRSGDRFVKILRWKSVETNMDILDRVTAAVLLPGALYMLKCGPFGHSGTCS